MKRKISLSCSLLFLVHLFLLFLNFLKLTNQSCKNNNVTPGLGIIKIVFFYSFMSLVVYELLFLYSATTNNWE